MNKKIILITAIFTLFFTGCTNLSMSDLGFEVNENFNNMSEEELKQRIDFMNELFEDRLEIIGHADDSTDIVRDRETGCHYFKSDKRAAVDMTPVLKNGEPFCE